MIKIIIPIGAEIVEPEKWIPIAPINIGENILPYYSISNWGRIYNHITNSYLPKNICYDTNHYITVSLKTESGDKYFQPHRLVMQSFCYINNADQYEVNHKDFIKYHNWIWNLEWVTRRGNIDYNSNMDKYSTLTEEQVISICKYINSGLSTKQISKLTGIKSLAAINCIKSRKTYTDISRLYLDAIVPITFND